MRTTTIALPGNPRRYIDALQAGATALRHTNPDAARLLTDVADSTDQTRRQRDALNTIARDHQPRTAGGDMIPVCYRCMTRWPCREADQLQSVGIRFNTPNQP